MFEQLHIEGAALEIRRDREGRYFVAGIEIAPSGADASSGAAQLAGMVPYFVLMAVLYGALSAALDTTAGERERGSLEPLLMTPALRMSLVLGKWGAVAALAMLIAVLACLSLLPTQALLRSAVTTNSDPHGAVVGELAGVAE